MDTGWTVDWLPVVWLQLFKLSFFRSLRSLFSHNPLCPYKLDAIILSSGSSFRLFPSRYISEFLRLPSNFPDKLGWLSIDRLSFFFINSETNFSVTSLLKPVWTKVFRSICIRMPCQIWVTFVSYFTYLYQLRCDAFVFTWWMILAFVEGAICVSRDFGRILQF